MKEIVVDLLNHSARMWICDDIAACVNNIELTSKRDGSVWNIKEATGSSLGKNADAFYTGMTPRDGLLVVSTFRGICLVVDPDKKEVVEKRIMK